VARRLRSLRRMIRISELSRSDVVVRFRLEGRLTEAAIPELAAALAPSLERGATALLDVGELTFADAAGVRYLRALRGRGAVLGACSGLIGELLRSASVPSAPIAVSASAPDGVRRTDGHGSRPRFDRDGRWLEPPRPLALGRCGGPPDAAARALLRGYMAFLPERASAALSLHDGYGLGMDEVAVRLGTDAATARRRVHHARQALLELIAAGAIVGSAASDGNAVAPLASNACTK
jgi:hypothetical protein